MKKYFLVVFTIFQMTAVSYAQKIEDVNITRVFWTKDAKCAGIDLPTVRNESLRCSAQEVDGRFFFTIYYNNISCAFSFYTFDEDILRSTFQIGNNSGKAIFIDVEKSYIAKYESEDSFLKNEKSKQFKFALNAEKLADKYWLRSVQGSSNSSNDTGIRPGLAVQSRIVYEEGNREMIIVEPKTEKKQTQNVIVEKKVKSSVPKQIKDTALTSKNLPDKDKTEGKVYFKKYPGAGYRAIFMRIDNLEFVFPFK